MATTTNFSVRMDSDIKKQCEALYGELGINLTTAINVFLRQSLRVGGFPFYKHSKTLHRIKGSFTNPQGIYLVEKRTLQNAKSFFLAGLAGFEPTR